MHRRRIFVESSVFIIKTEREQVAFAHNDSHADGLSFERGKVSVATP